MRRNPEELNLQFKALIENQSEDAIASFLEDLNDSVVDAPDTTNMVEKSEYEKIISERDAALESARSYRERYINRFYEPRNDERQQDYIMSATPQMTIEEDEKYGDYETLYE